MPDSGIDGKYGEITAERKTFHPGEPVFLLRATDRLAGVAIRYYAHVCTSEGCDEEHVAAAYGHAERIEAWQAQNPDLVKRPD